MEVGALDRLALRNPSPRKAAKLPMNASPAPVVSTAST
jgi:hypothetical protein